MACRCLIDVNSWAYDAATRTSLQTKTKLTDSMKVSGGGPALAGGAAGRGITIDFRYVGREKDNNAGAVRI
jgi:hypothetical protein